VVEQPVFEARPSNGATGDRDNTIAGESLCARDVERVPSRSESVTPPSA